MVSTPSTTQSSLVYRPDSFVERLNVKEIFPVEQPLEVEIGAGDGSFLAKYAALHPERNFLAVERLLGRLRKLDKKGNRAGLKNLRLIRIEAAYFTEYLLPIEGVQCLHIYFPDPWPKRRHWKNRLINGAFTEMVRRVLKADGVIYLRTDNAEYFAQMIEVFSANPNYSAVETPAELAAVITDFERQFNAQGIATRRAAFQKRA